MRKILPALLFLMIASSVIAGQPARYRGRWLSNTNGHNGRLNVKLKPTRAGDYRAVFTGTFLKVVPFVYATRMTPVSRSGNATTLVSEQHLPLVGTFRARAHVTPGSFNATYSSKNDRGTFTMSRR